MTLRDFGALSGACWEAAAAIPDDITKLPVVSVKRIWIKSSPALPQTLERRQLSFASGPALDNHNAVLAHRVG